MRKSPPRVIPPPKTAPVEERELYWRGQIVRWQASGLSQSGYSRENGLRPNQLSYWYRREQRLSAEDKKSPEGGFIPLEVISERELTGLSVKLPSGVVIEGVTVATLEVAHQLIVRL